jgi:hypothetical protein
VLCCISGSLWKVVVVIVCSVECFLWLLLENSDMTLRDFSINTVTCDFVGA